MYLYIIGNICLKKFVVLHNTGTLRNEPLHYIIDIRYL